MLDYMLREGLYDSAQQLAQSTGVEQLVDIDIFMTSRKVVEALQKKDCSEALKWCAENRKRLLKIDSSLEFKLRVQQYVELKRAGRVTDAIAHMRKFVAPLADMSAHGSSASEIAGCSKFEELSRAVTYVASVSIRYYLCPLR